MKNKRYYLERASYMRELARDALTDALRRSCLKAADAYDILAENADKVAPESENEE